MMLEDLLIKDAPNGYKLDVVTNYPLKEVKGYSWKQLIREPKTPTNARSSTKSTFLIMNSWKRQAELKLSC
jgi:hypothetical protein